MNNVKLLDGMFKQSQDKGKEYLLYLDLDRLIAPCYEAAGQKPKKLRYGGWEAKEIAGHSIGHWLSAASSMYAVTGDIELKNRLEYAIDELSFVQALIQVAMLADLAETALTKYSAENSMLNILV